MTPDTPSPGITGDFPPQVIKALDARIGRELARFDNLTWLDGTVSARATNALRRDLQVTSACGLAMTPSGALVLVNVASRGWDLPGGHLEGDETPLEALSRELREEAGLDISSARTAILGVFLVTRTGETTPSSQMALYRVELTKEPALSVSAPDEIVAVDLFALDTLPLETQELIWAPFIELLASPQ